jgi:hypothetical protein
MKFNSFWYDLNELVSVILIRLIWLPTTRIPLNIFTLGSTYARLAVVDSPLLNYCYIISCGVGLDISFELELIAYYTAKCTFVDPTPKSVIHFNAIIQRLSQPSYEPYSLSGDQPVTSYDLSLVSRDQLKYIAKSVWTKDDISLRLYSHRNRAYVSHSAFNISGGSRYIDTTTISLSRLLEESIMYKHCILKLDIEGAECHLIKTLVNSSYRPSLLLVEYDMLYASFVTSVIPFFKSYLSLLHCGYYLYDRRHVNFSFIHRSALEEFT